MSKPKQSALVAPEGAIRSFSARLPTVSERTTTNVLLASIGVLMVGWVGALGWGAMSLVHYALY